MLLCSGMNIGRPAKTIGQLSVSVSSETSEECHAKFASEDKMVVRSCALLLMMMFVRGS